MAKNNFIIATVTIIMIFSALVVSSLYMGEDVGNEKAQKTKISKIVTQRINMQGMTCDSCEELINTTASKIDGVVSVSSSSPAQEAIVEYDTAKTDIESIMKAIAKTGYKTLSFEDVNTSKDIKKQAIDSNKTSTMKCGAGKCGASMK